MEKAILIIDFINEIVHEKGKLASKGYADFVNRKEVLKNLSFAIKKSRENKLLIIHVRVGFSNNYNEQPKDSPLFGKAHEFQALKLNTWATEFHEKIDVKEEDIIITKHRVGAFHSTKLDLVLKNNNIKKLFVAGVATDLAVSNTVREAHDRDYQVIILDDCCAAANEADHENSLNLLKKIARVKSSKEVF